MNNNDNFYLVIPVGFEQLAAKELLEKWPKIDADQSAPQFSCNKGGIELNCPTQMGFLLNYYLKIPTRILLRVDSFKCRDFPKLYKRLQKIDWKKYLAGQAIEVKSSAANSRLFDSRKIEKTVQDALKKYFIANAPKKKHLELAAKAPTTAIYLRFDSDLCTISIDTSGEKLYRRSYRKHIGEAPIRENIAAGLLLKLKEHTLKELKYNLIDPMCGSATFLLESEMFNIPSDSRLFTWQFFPIAKQENPIKKGKPLFSSVKGFDKDEEVLKAAKENICLAGGNIQVAQMDLFSSDMLDGTNNVVIINPPYGKRISVDNLGQFFKEMTDQIIKKFNPDVIGIIAPEDVRFKHPKVVEQFKFKNGGLNVCFYVLITV